MYKNFYGLKRNPFELSPDPYFFYPTPAHHEALASLCYGIEKHKGFIVLTGEVGTGKTLLVRFVIEALHRNRTPYSYIVNPRFTPTELLHYMLADLGVNVSNVSRSELLLQLNHFLIEQYRQGSTPVLLIDEAHLMSWELLEEIRLLTNLETTRQKLLQIVLIGQTELDRRLDTQELRQLKQRVVFRCQLRPLNQEEVRGYVIRHLELAGAGERRTTIFPDAALARIVRHCGGIPRLINSLCEGSLIGGYARHQSSVSPEVVDEAAADLRLGAEEASIPAETEEDRADSAVIDRLRRLLHVLDSESSAIARRHSHPRSPRI